MAVPRQRKTKSRRNQRRMHIFLKAVSSTACLKCGKQVLPHTVCRHCGYYKGREMIDILGKLERKEKKKREKEIAAKADQEKEAKTANMENLSKK